ncbi:MAG: WG repeat-containing protein, partial [Parcubacteria group bacterium]|nr:WG repeat-containing protein [Parcubacteria group bacterium]
YGYIDINGSIVIPHSFNSAWAFSEGLARAIDHGKRVYIDKKGKVAISGKNLSNEMRREFDGIRAQYLNFGDFHEGLAYVKFGLERGELYGYINKQGDFVIPPTMLQVNDFNGGLAKVTSIRPGDNIYRDVIDRGMSTEYIDRTGKVVFDGNLKKQQSK